MTSSKPIEPRQVPPPEGGAERQNHAYARFIPREELGGFAAWTPGAFGEAPRAERRATAAAPVPASPPAAPPAPPTEAQWQARIDQARQQGWQDGHRDGLEALDAAKRQFAQQTSHQMSVLLASMQAQFDALEQQLAGAVTRTAVLLARQVVRSELSQRPELIGQVALQAVEAMMVSAKQLRLRLHPNDLTLVTSAVGEALQARQVVFQSDEGVEPGGCLLESELGKVDARIASRWAQAAAVFAVPVSWNEDEPGDEHTRSQAPVEPNSVPAQEGP
jgi:flagellar assembly protein FliH